MGFNYLLIFPPYYVALCASKTQYRLGSESVSWCLETFLFLRLPSQDGAPSLPLWSLFLSFIFFSYLFSNTMGCFSGCLMSSASIQKLFCGFYSAFKCSFDEFVGEKVVFLSYSSAILGPPLSSLIMYKTLGSTSLPIQPNWNLTDSSVSHKTKDLLGPS